MKNLLVVDRRSPQVHRLVKPGEDVDLSPWPPVAAGGLRYVTVDDAQYETLLRGQLPVLEDHDLGSPLVVRGGPMDIHGGGIPLMSRLRLPSRVRPKALAGAANPFLGEDELAAGEGVLVGSADTGVQPNEWLNGGYLSAPDDFEELQLPRTEEDARAGEDPPRSSQLGHGTFIAGLVLQQAPAAGVWVERVLSPSGEAPASSVAASCAHLARRRVDILNLSLGAFSDDPHARAVMQQMVADLHRINPGMVIVAAAGNLEQDGEGQFGPPSDFWPAAVDNVVAVGAVESPGDRRWAEWSNRGPWIDFAAPGHDLLSTYVTGCLGDPETDAVRCYDGWATWSGTSFAAAVVSGAIARLVDPARGVTAADALALLRTGEHCYGWTDPEDGVPSVPVVELETWGDQCEAKERCRRETAASG